MRLPSGLRARQLAVALIVRISLPVTASQSFMRSSGERPPLTMNFPSGLTLRQRPYLAWPSMLRSSFPLSISQTIKGVS